MPNPKQNYKAVSPNQLYMSRVCVVCVCEVHKVAKKKNNPHSEQTLVLLHAAKVLSHNAMKLLTAGRKLIDHVGETAAGTNPQNKTQLWKVFKWAWLMSDSADIKSFTVNMNQLIMFLYTLTTKQHTITNMK